LHFVQYDLWFVKRFALSYNLSNRKCCCTFLPGKVRVKVFQVLVGGDVSEWLTNHIRVNSVKYRSNPFCFYPSLSGRGCRSLVKRMEGDVETAPSRIIFCIILPRQISWPPKSNAQPSQQDLRQARDQDAAPAPSLFRKLRT